MKDLEQTGWAKFPADARSLAWAKAAREVAEHAIQDAANDRWFRHGRTWFVGVNLLETSPTGAIGGEPLDGPALDAIREAGAWPKAWDRAQLSVIFPGYPQQDPGESDAAHQYRQKRDAAHVDGLLPVGPNRRRMAQEFHGFILGLPLGDTNASPLVVWEGSHKIMQATFRDALAGLPSDHWAEIDVTERYHAARREAIETCHRVTLPARFGEATLLHPMALHGVAPWEGSETQERMIAYFRPEIAPQDWLSRW